MNKNDKVYIAGHRGLVGNSINNLLIRQGYSNIATANKNCLDLTDFVSVKRFFDFEKPEYVFLAAAKVGGIHANNTYPADFIYNNLSIQTNVIEACRLHNVKKLMFLGSVCIYPKYAETPVKEDSLLTSCLEPTNQWYAIAKIAGIKMCQAYRKQYGCDFISVMPCNLYGPNDNFHPTNSHVIPSLIRKFVEAKKSNAKEVVCWGTGKARREFMYVDDLADACVFLMNNYSDESIINIGIGVDYTIKDVAELIADIVGFNGHIIWDDSKPDGTPKRMLDATKLFNLGWKPKTELRDGLKNAIDFFVKNVL